MLAINSELPSQPCDCGSGTLKFEGYSAMMPCSMSVLNVFAINCIFRV